MGCVSKCGLIFINLLVVAAGICVVAVAVAVLRQETIFGVLLTQVFYTVPFSALLAGLFHIFLGILGIVGAAKENTCMLKTYAIIVTVLLIGVVVLGVSLLVFTLGSWTFLEDVMTSVFNKYDGNSTGVSHDLDVLQNTIHCCGIYGYKDWVDFTYGNGSNVADGCCRNMTEGCGVGLLKDPEVEDLVYTKGCMAFVTNALADICLVLGLLTLFLAGVQLLSIAWACIIARDVIKYRRL